MAKSPAFQWYARDFAIDTQAMTAEEVGVYVRLLNACWIGIEGAPQAHIVADEEKLRRIAGVTPARWRSCRDAVLSKFSKNHDGLLASKRMLEELEKQKETSGKAAASARKRWGEERNRKAQEECERNANALPTQCETDANGMRSACSASASALASAIPSGEGSGRDTPQRSEREARAQPPAGPPNPKPVANGRPPDVGGDAGHAISAWDRFWAAYPLKAAELEGQRAFSEVFDDLPPIDDLLKILADQIGANAETGKEWKLHAKNWLRNKRWRDEIVRRERPEVLQARIEALTQVRGMARQYPDQVPAGRAMILRELPPLLRRADLKAEIRPDLSLDEWGKVANMADSALVAARAALAALPRQLQAVAHG